MDQDEGKGNTPAKPKPIPIREAVGEPLQRDGGKPRTSRNVPTSQAPGLRGQRERPKGPSGRGSSRKDEGNGRRRPDRKGAGSSGERPSRPALEPTTPDDLPSRRFEHDGGEWVVRLCGQTSTGRASDRGAPLMHLVFYSAADPLVAYGEVFLPTNSLDGLPEGRLRELLDAVGSPTTNESSG